MDDLRSGLEGKLLAQLVVCQASLGKVRNSITFVSAASARMAMPGTAGLAAINGAIERALPVLAKELAPLRVNSVSPGVVDTPWWNGMPADAKEAFFQHARQSLPVRKVGQPEDVAAAISMLIDNPFITGTVLEVDGGAHLG
jgi:NAD(P)-dependent dehydrogenase (short-subunit alcohol dehydrogenase family)